MAEPRPVLDPGRVGLIAKVIHFAMVAGVTLFFAIILYLRSVLLGSNPLGAESARTLRIVGYLFVAATVLIPYLLRGRIRPPDRGADLNRWWGSSLAAALTVWAVAEGGGLAALILGAIVGDTTLLALGAAAALAVLFVNRPAALARGL